MNLLTAQNAIIARLKDQIKAEDSTDFQAPKIDSFPRDPTQYFDSIHSNGEILIRFERFVSEQPEPNRSNYIVQNLSIEWSIWIVSRDLINPTNKTKGAYYYIDKVKDALSGWTISLTEGSTTTTWNDSTPIYFTNGEFVEESEGVWFYALTIEHVLEEK